MAARPGEVLAVPVDVAAGSGRLVVRHTAASPAVDQVGWYRFGARPGDEGSAVLAAHVAYDGVDGVFRRLADVSDGGEVRVGFADGTEQAFAVTAVARYPKSDLPADVWRRAGDPELVLITCGGEFDPGARSYEDNVVVDATPA